MVESNPNKKTKNNFPTFSENALLLSKMFTPIERDILRISLDDDKNYTMAEANKVIATFKGGI